MREVRRFTSNIVLFETNCTDVSELNIGIRAQYRSMDRPLLNGHVIGKQNAYGNKTVGWMVYCPFDVSFLSLRLSMLSFRICRNSTC